MSPLGWLAAHICAYGVHCFAVQTAAGVEAQKAPLQTGCAAVGRWTNNWSWFKGRCVGRRAASYPYLPSRGCLHSADRADCEGLRYLLSFDLASPRRGGDI